jgi:hypothetical protein
MYRFSRYFKDPRRRETALDEIDAGNRALDDFDALDIPWHWCLGNHEHRYSKYLSEEAPELVDVAPSLSDLFRLRTRKRGTWSEYGVPYRRGHIRFIHDVGPSGAAAMAQSLSSFGASLVFGHTHRLGVTYQGTLEGERRVAMNVGWLGDLGAVDYLKKHQTKDWQTGFGIVDIDERGIGYCQAIPIIGGRCIIDGKTVRG